MIAWLKKHFIPHEDNNHRPHILRKNNVRSIIVVVLFLELVVFLIPTLARINTTGQMAAILPAVLSMLTNEERQAQNLQTLTISPILNQAAEMKANDMATYGYFAHVSPEGKTPWYWIEQAGYQYQYAGENLAVDFSDSKDVTSAWMASPTHRENIVKGNYTEIGTGIAHGTFQGRATVFVAQVYANPVVATQAQPQIVIQEETPNQSSTEDGTGQATTDSTSSPSSTEETTVAILGAEMTAPSETPENNELEKIAPSETPENNEPEQEIIIAGTATPAPSPTNWQKALASPRNTMNMVLFTVLGIMLMALLLNTFIKIKHHHFDLVTNGLTAVAIIGAIFVGNYYESHRHMIIIQSMDYANEIAY